MMNDDLHLDLDSLARKVIQRVDRRYQVAPRQPVTRIAVQANGEVVTNKHRSINIRSGGANVVADPVLGRSNIHIPCGYLYCLVDGGGLPIIASSRPQTSVHVHDNLEVVQWTVVGDTNGTITFDLRSASFADYPSTSTIIVGTHPVLAAQQKNSSVDYIDPTTGEINPLWEPLGWTPLNIGDIIDVLVTSAATITRVTLTLFCRAIG